ncbi:hypothetical protein KIN20_016832 [Parelaphostrongylus tenuis]|uniref:Uncharacterized protein n=1 Tax=Parelaphostrongylus tenuis TaxID=148309 RepID=A0AAD5MH20_PARTN|nr:hypothetical protein KIN20_016832 [Parelaphostrongylus tenuis]
MMLYGGKSTSMEETILAEAAGHIKFLVIALQEAKIMEMGVNQWDVGTVVIRGVKLLIQRIEGVDFVVYPYDFT